MHSGIMGKVMGLLGSLKGKRLSAGIIALAAALFSQGKMPLAGAIMLASAGAFLGILTVIDDVARMKFGIVTREDEPHVKGT